MWKDDNQIAEITSSKRYGIEPKIIIRYRRNIRGGINGEKSKNCNNKR
ncbi:TPA: hypothetical protein SIJ44_001824 [Staphylococcus aureus]|nr:hypothetical protein [Staphylococcus aureus]